MRRSTLALLAALSLVPIAALADENAPTQFNEMSIAELQARMAAGKLTSVELTRYYLTRIGRLDKDRLKTIIEVNPDAMALAQAADAERRNGIVRGPLHGIP